MDRTISPPYVSLNPCVTVCPYQIPPPRVKTQDSFGATSNLAMHSPEREDPAAPAHARWQEDDVHAAEPLARATRRMAKLRDVAVQAMAAPVAPLA